MQAPHSWLVFWIKPPQRDKPFDGRSGFLLKQKQDWHWDGSAAMRAFVSLRQRTCKCFLRLLRRAIQPVSHHTQPRAGCWPGTSAGGGVLGEYSNEVDRQWRGQTPPERLIAAIEFWRVLKKCTWPIKLVVLIKRYCCWFLQRGNIFRCWREHVLSAGVGSGNKTELSFVLFIDVQWSFHHSIDCCWHPAMSETLRQLHRRHVSTTLTTVQAWNANVQRHKPTIGLLNLLVQHYCPNKNSWQFIQRSASVQRKMNMPIFHIRIQVYRTPQIRKYPAKWIWKYLECPRYMISPWNPEMEGHESRGHSQAGGAW